MIASSLLQKTTKALGVAGVCATGVLTYRYQKVKEIESTLPNNTLWSFKNKPTDKKKNVVIIGGGVVGITAAYKLALKGHSVALLEPRSEPGKECSSCAAGGMQRSNPVVDKATWLAVTKSFFPFTKLPYEFFHIDWLSTVTDPFFLRWSLKFAKTSLFPCSEQKNLQREMLEFTDYAVSDMVALMEKKRDPMAKRAGYNPNGSLSLSYDPPPKVVEKDNAGRANPIDGKTYEPNSLLVGNDISLTEPSILHQKVQPQSAKFEYKSCAASAERFTEELADRCAKDEKLDVTFFYNTCVQGVTCSENNRVTKLQTNRGTIDTDHAEVVLAAGAWNPHIGALMDLYIPVYPLKGYAMSLSAKQVLSSTALKASDLPSRIVCDKYMFTTRLGDDEIRITSIGEFSGWSTQPTPKVDKEFKKEAIRQFPQLEAYIKEANVRCGHRPYVSDGVLLLGRVPFYANLLVSCGPGSNGWKLAMGSGEIVERLVSGKTEDDISKALGFDAHTFSPAGRVKQAPFFSKLCLARWGVKDIDEKEDAVMKESS